MKMSTKKWIFLAVAIVAGAVLSMITPPEGLTVSSMRVLGILLFAIVLWAGEVFPEVVTGLIMSTLFVVYGQVAIGTSFSAFSGTTFWLLVPAFALGAAIKSCGLLERVCLLLLKLFPKSYKGQILGLMTVSTITSPFVPSKAAKNTILAPLTRGMSDAMGYEPGSKEAVGMFQAFFSAICFSAAMFISASVTTYALVGMYSEDIQAKYTMVTWFLHSLPWAVPFFLANYFYISRRYKPKDNSKKLDNAYLEEKLKELGPWTKQEKTMGIIMVVTVLMWVFKSALGVAEYATAIFACCATVIFGILPVKNFRTHVAWESLIFIACAVSLSSILPAVDITTWLVATVGPYTTGFFANPFLLILGLAVLTILVRFLILSEIGFLSVFTALLCPLGIAAGINPWIIGFVMNAFVVVWFLPYESSVYLTAMYSAGDGWLTFKDTTKYCYVYCAMALVCLYVAYFIWKVMGVWFV